MASIVALGFGSIVASPASASSSGTGAVISEVYFSGGRAGAAFKNKFVELYNPTAAAVTLDGTLLQYRLATGTANFTGVAPLTGVIPPGGYFLVQANGNGANDAELPAPDVVSTLEPSGTTGTLALVAVTTAVALAPGSVAGADGVIDLLGYGTSNTFDTFPAKAPAGKTDVKALNRTGGADTDDNSADFMLSATIASQNSGAGTDPGTGPSTELATATMAEIQGTGDASSIDGQTVTTEGVVTGDYRTGGYRGIAIQTRGCGEVTDATPDATDGIFVFLNVLAPELAIGDLVSVTGKVSEYYG